MSHVLTLTDGTVTLDMAETTDAGYHFVSFGAPRPNRKLTRVGAYPFANGERTVASGLGDVAAEIILNIVGSSADDLDAKLRSLVTLLEQAQRWEEQHIGSPVRLLFKRQGVTNTSYRVVTGVPLMPEPVDPGEINWLDGSSIMNEMTVAFTITLEPVAHAGALTSIAATQPVTAVPDLDYVFASAAAGSMPSPLSVAVTNTSGATFSDTWLARLEFAPVVKSHTGTADATAFGGSYESVTATGTEISASHSFFSGTTNVPFRGIARIKLLTGIVGALRLQVRGSIGATTTALHSGEWVTFSGGVGSWILVDLGKIRFPDAFTNRTGQVTTSMRLAIWAKTSDGATVTFAIDYAQMLPYHTFVKIPGSVPTANVLHYDMVLKDGTFFWPNVAPQTYVTLSDGTLVNNIPRYGMLSPVPTGEILMFWAAFLVAGAHQLTSTATVTIENLALYSLGLRGNA